MLHDMKELNKFDITAIDGPIGTVHDFLLDEKHWTVRYVVVDTMKWLPGKKVLISPMSVTYLNLVNGSIELSLTKEQIKNSPPVEADKPVSKKYEQELNQYYGFKPYWNENSIWGPFAYPSELAKGIVVDAEITINSKNHIEEFGLRSFAELTGYNIEVVDGRIGHVENFIVCQDAWKIHYLIVDTSNWWVGKHVLVSPDWINYVNWLERVVHVDVTKEQVENGPEYDASQGVTREFEKELYARYNK